MKKQKPELLVTTALEKTWGANEPLIFLGEWCKIYGYEQKLAGRSYTTNQYHWSDRAKLKKDYFYLSNLHELLVQNIAETLNNYHGVDASDRYWRMILDPWLLTYIAVIFDRWECLRLAFERPGNFETQRLRLTEINAGFVDYKDFSVKVLGDEWNHCVFLDIIESCYFDRCKILGVPSSDDIDNCLIGIGSDRKAGGRLSLKRRVGSLIDEGLGKLFKKNKVIFYESYFSFSALAKLNLRLGAFPRLYLRDFNSSFADDDFSQVNILKETRRCFELKMQPSTSFEAYLIKKIINDLPWTCVEGYQHIERVCAKIPMRPRVIVSATAHWNNEIFKHWAATQIDQGAKYVAIQHGGSINAGTMIAMNFEENLSDHYATPSLPTHEKHIQLPFAKTSGVKVMKGGEICSLLGFDSHRYAYRVQASPISGQVLDNYKQTIDFYSALKPEVQANFKVRPFAPTDSNWNTYQRYIDDVGSDKISLEENYNKFLSQSKIIICTYPNTTFAEAMASGIPNILLYPNHLWELPRTQELLEILMAAKIVFHDPYMAAEHINSIWNDPGRWWGEASVVDARREFCNQAVYQSDNWLNEWSSFIDNVMQ